MPSVPMLRSANLIRKWNTRTVSTLCKKRFQGNCSFVMNQEKPHLRYVFDVSDTDVRHSSPALSTWKVTNENRLYIMEAMERTFQVPSEGILEYQLENIAINLAKNIGTTLKANSRHHCR